MKSREEKEAYLHTWLLVLAVLLPLTMGRQWLEAEMVAGMVWC